jgi:hypothetical protein
VAWVRGENDPDYVAHPMQPAGGDAWEIEVPPGDTRGGRVTYLIEATDARGNAAFAGSPERPFVVRVRGAAREAQIPAGAGADVPGARGLGILALGVLAVLAPAAGAVFFVARVRRRRRDEAFWAALVAPLRDRAGPELSEALRDVASRTHVHPDRGAVKVERHELQARLDRLRQVEAARLDWAIETCAGADRHGSSAGSSMLELLAVLAIMGIGLGIGALYLRPIEAPLRSGGQLLEGMFKQARAKAIATTTAHRVRPFDDRTLVAELASSCSDLAWTVDPRMEVELPEGVTLDATAWSVCFNSRGTSSLNVVVTLEHPDQGQQTLEVLLGGSVRWLP